MSADNRRFWMVTIALALMAVVLYFLRGVLMPFVAGILIAYVLDPAADRLESWRVPRGLAAALVLVVFTLVLVGVIVLLIPVIVDQVGAFVAHLPSYIDEMTKRVMSLVQRFQENAAPERAKAVEQAAGSVAADAMKWFGGLAGQAWSGGLALVNIVSLVVVTPLVAFYMLRDWDRLVARIETLVPPRHREVVRDQAREVDQVAAGFIRAQALVCLLLGVFYAVGLGFVGLQFGLVIGLVTGLLTFIPYFGMLIGGVLGIVVAVGQFSDWAHVGMVIAVFAVGQFLEGNVVTPRLVGNRVRLHPVWIIFALLAGGALMGFTGVLLAVPAAAVIGVFVRFGVGRYRQSRLYGGGGATGS